MTTQPRVLSIAGTDPTGGAGIQADVKSIAAAGGYGMSVITSLVAQNTSGVRTIHTPDLDFLDEQLEAVFDDVTVDAVKIGMLGSVGIVERVSSFLNAHEVPVVVLDPVMIATSGDRLLDADAEASVREFAARVDVITPNLRELAVLVDAPLARDLDEAIEQARGFAASTHTTVIVKGGHLTGPVADNAVVTAYGTVHRVPSPRVDTRNTHGTGCSLSAALATRLGAGDSVEAALEWSTRWLSEAIRGADALNVGQGNGPVDHFHRANRLADSASAVPWRHVLVPGQTFLTGNDASDFVIAAQDEAPRPYLAPAGPYTAALWAATADVWTEIRKLPFIKGLRDGTLSQRDFHFYLGQDARYLNQYSRALAMLAAKAPDSQAQVEWATGSQECIVVEAALHRGEMAGLEQSAMSPVTMAYTDFLLARTAYDSYVIGAAAVLPCYWLYAEIGLMIAEANHPEHPYHAWLNTYGGEDFITGATAAIARVETALAAATPSDRLAAGEAYLSACVFERDFFDQADRVW